MKILHVEDDEDWRAMVARILDKHSVTSASSMAEAKAAFQPEVFGLVICDGSIDQDNDGRMWAQELHAQSQPVVILSAIAHPDIPSFEKGLFDPNELREFVKNLQV